MAPAVSSTSSCAEYSNSDHLHYLLEAAVVTTCRAGCAAHALLRPLHEGIKCAAPHPPSTELRATYSWLSSRRGDLKKRAAVLAVLINIANKFLVNREPCELQYWQYWQCWCWSQLPQPLHMATTEQRKVCFCAADRCRLKCTAMISSGAVYFSCVASYRAWLQ